jgi:hypothetical protein
MTFDQAALPYLLAGKPIPATLVRDASAAAGSLCPECGHTETECNGHDEYRCCACDHRWGYEGGAIGGERYGF